MDDWIKDLVNTLINTVLDALTSATQAALNWVLGLLSSTVFTSPNVTTLPQVTYIAGHAQLAANAFMVLIVMVVGIVAMTHGSVQERYALKEMLPRVVIGFAAANLAIPIVAAVIAGANAVTAAMVGDAFNSQDSFDQIKRVVIDTTSDPAMFLVALVLRELVLWMLVLLVITWLGRLSVLLVVAGTAPVALMCHALAFTEPVARIWWRSLLSCLAVQVLQAITLHMAVATLLSSNANLPALGLPQRPDRAAQHADRLFPAVAGHPHPQMGGPHLRRHYRPRRQPARLRRACRAGPAGARGARVARRQAAAPRQARGAAAGMRSPATHLHAHQHAGNTNQHLHQHLHVHPPRPGRPPTSPPPGGPTPGSPWRLAGRAATRRPGPGRRAAGRHRRIERPDRRHAAAGTAGDPARRHPAASAPLAGGRDAAIEHRLAERTGAATAGGRAPVGHRLARQATRADAARTVHRHGWPTSAGRPRPVVQPSRTGWPAGAPEWKTRGSGVRRGR